MDLNIARLGPATKQLERIADSLELIAALYKAQCDVVGITALPKKRVDDPAEADDVSYTDPDKEWLREMKKAYGVLSEEDKKIMKSGLSDDTVNILERGEE